MQKDVPKRTERLNHDLTLKDTSSPTGIGLGGEGCLCENSATFGMLIRIPQLQKLWKQKYVFNAKTEAEASAIIFDKSQGTLGS